MSVPVRIHERFSPASLLITPAGEQVLDFGQEITGWVEFDCRAEKGTEITLQYGAVSYTHLDVYKRQGNHGSVFGKTVRHSGSRSRCGNRKKNSFVQ